ncbi:MAG: hypothetical protein ACE5GH_04515 [Fidelibacterota bacterium]
MIQPVCDDLGCALISAETHPTVVWLSQQRDGGGKETISRNPERILETLSPVSGQIICRQELEGIREILEHGPSYRRQRNIYQRIGNFEAVMDGLMEAWKSDKKTEAV